MGSISPGIKRKTTAGAHGKVRQGRASSSAARDSRSNGSKSETLEEKPSEQDARSALHLAQVDALIKELQKTRGLLETPSSDHEKNISTGGRVAPVRALSMPLVSTLPATSEPQGQWVWIAGHDGVLRPDLGGANKSAVAPQGSPPASVPACVQFTPAQPMQRNIDLRTASAPGTSSLSRMRSRRSLEPRGPDPGAAFPTAFKGTNRASDTKGAIDMQARSSRSRNPSSWSTTRSAEDGNWRSSKMPKEPSPSPVRGTSPSGEAISQAKRWPTLDELCATKCSTSSSTT